MTDDVKSKLEAIIENSDPESTNRTFARALLQIGTSVENPGVTGTAEVKRWVRNNIERTHAANAINFAVSQPPQIESVQELKELVEYNKPELLKHRNIGEKTIEELELALRRTNNWT